MATLGMHPHMAGAEPQPLFRLVLSGRRSPCHSLSGSTSPGQVVETFALRPWDRLCSPQSWLPLTSCLSGCPLGTPRGSSPWGAQAGGPWEQLVELSLGAKVTEGLGSALFTTRRTG